ncbi:unnamed protein product [Polarella glacialis]|uniref:Uncharacterized protein n=1 Tax=Polarella glacialis TaxID=89957 RepID=A0A813I8Z0_POLGL|nr:unnamed protein product [Polarella glacialis]
MFRVWPASKFSSRNPGSQLGGGVSYQTLGVYNNDNNNNNNNNNKNNNNTNNNKQQQTTSSQAWPVKILSKIRAILLKGESWKLKVSLSLSLSLSLYPRVVAA